MAKDFDLSKVDGFEWDKGNILKSWIKHDVSPQECEEIFFNTPILVNRSVRKTQKEVRFQALGQTKKGKLIFFVFTRRKGKIRVISARPQSKKERINYRNKGGYYG